MITNSSKTITIGTFDGVHIGHQKILKRVCDLARSSNHSPTVLTLFPHPRMVLQPTDNIKLLNTIEERISILKQHGIESVIVKEFSLTFANLSAKDYVSQVLVNELNTKQVVIGYDHHFGKNRSANINDLRRFADQFGFEVEEISAQDIAKVTVSSTKIRNALNTGDITTANAYLGYNYFITGNVVKGKELGRTISFPTANIVIKEDYKLIPADGVYVVQSTINESLVFGMMNIGTNPTVDGKIRSIEVNFFDFNQNLYGKTLTIAFLKRLRSEKKFKNLEALKAQLKLDMKAAKDFLKSYDA